MPYKKLSLDEMPYKAKPSRMGGPLWDLYRDGVTQGFINLFFTCREQARLIMVEGWSAKKSTTALEFGSAFHYCCSQLQGSHVTPERSKACKTPAGAVSRYMRQFKATLKLAATDQEDLALLMNQVRIVLEHYLDYWKKDDAAKDWVAREKTFFYPYDVLDSELKFQAVPLRGRWDGLYRKRKGLWLHETKTKGTIDEDGLKASLPFDFQTMLYCYVAEKHFNEPVAGTLYDVVRRPQLKLGKNETTKQFLDRIDKDISERPTFYFHRWEVSLGKHDIENWEKQQLAPMMFQIVQWNQEKEKGIYHYQTPKALFSTFGRCDLFNLLTTGNTYGLYRRKYPYPELID